MEYLHQVSYNWFLLYYITLGALLLAQGFIWSSRPGHFVDYMVDHAKKNEQPKLILKTLRYLFLFSAMSLALSFFPFSWIEMLFSAWSLVMVYILGSLILRWKFLSQVILEGTADFQRRIRTGGVMMLSLGILMFLMAYQLVTRYSV